MTEEDEELEKGWKRELFHVGLGTFVAAPSIPLFCTLVSAIFAFFAGKAATAAGSPETTTTYSEKRQPVFHAVSPFCLPAASRSTRFFSTLLSAPRRPSPDHRSRKTSLQAWEFKGTTSPATSMWMWQVKGRGDSAKMVQCGKTTLTKVPTNVIFWPHTDGIYKILRIYIKILCKSKCNYPMKKIIMLT